MTSPCPSRSTPPVICRAADSLRDDDWDTFLQGTELGHFQQSSSWAQYKDHEGWQPERVILSDDAGPKAGFQLLWRRSRLGRIGYISKGPASRDAASAPWDELTREILTTASRLRLQAVIIQSPDEAPEAVPVLRRHGFLDNHLHDVIRATLRIDLTVGWDRVRSQYRKGTVRAIQQVVRAGYSVREGGEEDLPRFFAQMCAMCARLGKQPNPETLASLHALWRAFHGQGLARLLLACRGPAAGAGLLLLRFGDRLTAWKQGCDPRQVPIRPDPMLFAEAIRLGADTGCRSFDFVALHPEAARAMERGEGLSRDPRFSRDFFHVGFGGEPRSLPDPLVWFPHPLVRRWYRWAVRIPGFRSVRAQFAARIRG